MLPLPAEPWFSPPSIECLFLVPLLNVFSWCLYFFLRQGPIRLAQSLQNSRTDLTLILLPQPAQPRDDKPVAPCLGLLFLIRDWFSGDHRFCFDLSQRSICPMAPALGHPSSRVWFLSHTVLRLLISHSSLVQVPHWLLTTDLGPFF